MKKFFLFLVTLFLIILILSTAEILLRVFRPVLICNTVSEFRYDKNAGVTTRPNLDFSIVTDHIIEVFTNDIGSKNYLSKDELLKYNKVIFCVGDSFTEGIGNSTDTSYPFYLDLILNRENNDYKRRFAVFNLGVGGYGSMQAYLSCITYAKEIGRLPDIVIFFICPNDFSEDLRFEKGICHHHPVPNSPYYPDILVKMNRILERFQVYLRIKYSFMRRITKQKYPAEDIAEDAAFKPEKLPGLLKLIEFSRVNDIKLIISYTNYKSRIYDEIKDFAGKNYILFADYRQELGKTASVFKNLPVRNRHSGGHFRPWVNFIIADNFAILIRRD